MRPSRPDRFDVVVYGDYFADWLPKLAPEAPLWQDVPEAASVHWRPGGWRGEDIDPNKRLIFPLLEPNIRNFPGGWGLIPTPVALATLADKAAFARYLADYDLERYAPRTFRSQDEVVFPAVVKRTDMYAGLGIALVHSHEEIAATLKDEMFAGWPVIFQEYIAGELEYVHQAVVVDGMIVWSVTQEVVIPPEKPVRRPNVHEDVRIVQLPASELFAMQRVIAPLGFSGPVNFNFRRRPGADLALFEINPRIGGSMFRAVSRDKLPEEIGVIARHATWHRARGEAAGS